MNKLSPLERRKNLLILLIWIVSVICLNGMFPQFLDSLFVYIAERLDTHKPWLFASYEFRPRIVTLHYLTIFAIILSFILGAFTPRTDEQKETITKVSYFRAVIAICVIYGLAFLLVFWFGSETFIAYEPEAIEKSVGTRFFNSWIGILFLEYLIISLWIYAGFFTKSLVLKLSNINHHN